MRTRTFSPEAINRFEDKINYEIVDISKTSIDITKSIIDFNVKKTKYSI